jgi:hypothetical protein
MIFFHYKDNEKETAPAVNYSCHKVQLPLIKTESGWQNVLNNTMETESENLDCGKLKRGNNQFLQQMNCRIKKKKRGILDEPRLMNACLKCMKPWVPSETPQKPVWYCMTVISIFGR